MDALERLRAASAQWQDPDALLRASLAPVALDESVKRAANALAARAPGNDRRGSAALIAAGYAVGRCELGSPAPSLRADHARALLETLRALDLRAVRKAAGPAAAKACTRVAGKHVPRQLADRAFAIGLGLAVAENRLDV